METKESNWVKIDARGKIILVPLDVISKSPVFVNLTKHQDSKETFQLNFSEHVVHDFIDYLAGYKIKSLDFIVDICNYMGIDLPVKNEQNFASVNYVKEAGEINIFHYLMLQNVPLQITCSSERLHNGYRLEFSTAVKSLSTAYNLDSIRFVPIRREQKQNCTCQKKQEFGLEHEINCIVSNAKAGIINEILPILEMLLPSKEL